MHTCAQTALKSKILTISGILGAILDACHTRLAWSSLEYVNVAMVLKTLITSSLNAHPRTYSREQSSAAELGRKL